MNKTHFPLSEINNTKDLLNVFRLGKKTIGSLIFWILKQFLEDIKNPTTYRLNNLAYKALKSFPILAVQLLQLYGRSALKTHFKEWLLYKPSRKSKNIINARVDGSKTGRKYGFYIPELQWLYDYVTKSKMLTHEIYVFLVSIGDKDYVVDFKLKKKVDKGTNRIAQRMIYDLYNSMGKLKAQFRKWFRISLDGAFGNGSMISWFAKHDLTNVAIKSGGKDLCKFMIDDRQYNMTLKGLEDFLSKLAIFKKFNPCHKLKGEYTDIEVEIAGRAIKVVLMRYRKRNNNGYRYLMILSPNLTWHAFQIVQTYKGRWGIEVMFRTCKQEQKIERYHFHSKDTTENIEMHFALRFIGYMWLNWYRVEHTRRSITSLSDVIIRWKQYLNDLSPRAFLLLFSG